MKQKDGTTVGHFWEDSRPAGHSYKQDEKEAREDHWRSCYNDLYRMKIEFERKHR